MGNAHPTFPATLSAALNLLMPLAIAKEPDPLSELDRRHDDALRQLDELDQRIEQALQQFSAVQKETTERFGRTQKAAA